MTLTKAQIVEEIAAKNSFTKNKSFEILETFLEIIKRSLVSGEDVMVSGFGKFSVQSKKERKGRNPATGETLMLKPRKIVAFKWSGKLKERLNEKG